MADNSPRPWTAFTKTSGSSDNSSPPQSSSASVYSLRKRSSFFFGRSRSNATKARQQLPPMGSTTEQIEGEPTRPPTAHSTQTARSRKEPLNAIRNTLLASRRKNGEDQIRSRADLEAQCANDRQPLSSILPPASQEAFKSGDQYYHHLRKQSISPPFNFEHRAHTARTQLPPLDTVDERDLRREFWTASSRHRPRRHLHGIQADDIAKLHTDLDSSRPTTARSLAASPTSPSDLENFPPHIPTPIEPIAHLDETIFDGVSKDLATRVDSVRTPPNSDTSGRLPKRQSSLNALKATSEGAASSVKDPITFYESDSSKNSSGDRPSTIVPETRQKQTPPIVSSASPTMPGERPGQEELEFRSTQPLPPVPGQTSIRRYRNNSLRHAETTLGPSASLKIPNPPTGSPVSKRSSKRSSRSSRSVRKSPSQASSTDIRQSASVSDTTWEDDVDFIYQQEAESTCNFNWNLARDQRTKPAEIPGNAGEMGSPYHAHSPVVELESFLAAPVNHSRETIAERRSSKKGDELSRASSVGHRGFLAARRSSQDLTRMPNPIHITPSSSHASLLSPVFSVSGADDTDNKTPYTPTTLHYSTVTSANSDFLSDPESCRNSGSTRHRKSSSYGSYESRARPPPAAPREATARWSVASANSLPELTHSRPRSKLILSKTIISKPLETLPQSPPYHADMERGEDSPIVPREYQTQPVRQSFLVRKPQTPSDRAVLQAAGTAAQRRGSRTDVLPVRVESGSSAAYGTHGLPAGTSGWI